MPEKTRRKHIDNCWYIGYLECNFGSRDKFVPEEVFSIPDAPYDYEFKSRLDAYPIIRSPQFFRQRD